MAGNSNPVVVGIRFGKLSKIYNFDATGLDEIHLKDLVVVETCKGKQIGEVVKIYQDYEMKDEPLKKVERIATAGELVSNEFWNLRKKEYKRQLSSEKKQQILLLQMYESILW